MCLAFRLMTFEGGFYSLWQGEAFPIIYLLLDLLASEYKEFLFHYRALQECILKCC